MHTGSHLRPMYINVKHAYKATWDSIIAAERSEAAHYSGHSPASVP